MKFVVFGGSGGTALLFTKHAVAAGDEVVSVVRSDKSDDTLKSLGARPVLLPLVDSSVQDIAALLKEHAPDAVLFAVGPRDPRDGTESRLLEHAGAIKIFDAMEDAGVRRLLMMGSLDTRSKEEPMPDYYDEQSIEASKVAWKEVAEYLVAKHCADLNLHTRTKIDWTILRPGYLVEEPAKGVEMGVTQGRPTYRDSAARALLAIAREPRSIGLTIDIIDGQGSITDELRKVVDGGIDAWKAYGHL